MKAEAVINNITVHLVGTNKFQNNLLGSLISKELPCVVVESEELPPPELIFAATVSMTGD